MVFVRALVIDDDPFVRSSLTAGLAHYGIQVKYALANGSNANQIIKEENIEVVIVDLDLGPGPSGIDILNSIRSSSPEIGLVLLTSYQDPRVFDPSAGSLPKGTKFISKSDLNDFKLLVDRVYSAKVKPLTAATREKSPTNPLTNNQLEVLKLVAEGLSSAEIAEIRKISVKAVEGTISKIQKILNISKSRSFNQRVQLARLYFTMSGKKPPGA
jgi:DNA-binding NarL/FixJ family response regulator